MLPTELAERFREMARIFKEHEERPVARAYEKCAADVEAAIVESENAILTIADAAEESGYSPSHLGRLLREGKIANAGRKGAPRIRRGDLPIRAVGSSRPSGVPSSARQVVRSVVSQEEANDG